MAFNKSEVMNWNAEDKRNLAFELLDSIDEQAIKQPISEWKEKLIRDRIEKDKQANDNIIEWSVLRSKYKP